jgi:hydrogenase maturation protease
MPVPKDIVVLAIGNVLRSDEGVAIHALRRLSSDHHFPESVRLIDGGVMGLDLLPTLEGCDALLVIDAVNADRSPGEVIRIEGDDAPAAFLQKLSMHQAGLFDLLALLQVRNARPPQMVIWGVQPASLEWNLDLSPTVSAAMPKLLEGITRDLLAWTASPSASSRSS